MKIIRTVFLLSLTSAFFTMGCVDKYESEVPEHFLCTIVAVNSIDEVSGSRESTIFTMVELGKNQTRLSRAGKWGEVGDQFQCYPMTGANKGDWNSDPDWINYKSHRTPDGGRTIEEIVDE
jgi:hypothetical protein